MMRTFVRAALAFVIIGAAVPPQAWAWGPNAKKSIAMMAMQLLRNDYPDIFQPGITSLEETVLAGVTDGYAALENREGLASDADTVQAVGSQIQLLRDVRPYGVNMFFAYRMGVLAGLTADVCIPFGFAWSADEQGVQERVNRDTEAHLDKFFFKPQNPNRAMIQSVRAFFDERRLFFHEDRRIIAEDYLKGAGYQGMLSNAAEVYFSRAVETVADVWNTALKAERLEFEVSVSAKIKKWYFVDEIAFLLAHRRFDEANEVYSDFAATPYKNPDIYEALGDVYYDSGTPETISLALREWTAAYRMAGPRRERVAQKLVQHYIRDGRSHLEKASQPGAEDQDLINALNSLEAALQIDNRNPVIADLIKETKVKQKEREEHLRFITDLIAQGQQLVERGQEAANSQDEANAIKTYRQAIAVFEGVDDTFKAQSLTAQNTISDLEHRIKTVLLTVVERATTAIEDGDAALGQNRHDESITYYESVPMILSVIPDDISQDVIGQRTQLLEQANQKLNDAKQKAIEFKKAQEAQQRQQQNRSGGGGGGSPLSR